MKELIKNKYAVSIILCLSTLCLWLFTYFANSVWYLTNIFLIFGVIAVTVSMITGVWFLYLIINKFKSIDFVKMTIYANAIILAISLFISVYDWFISDDDWHGLLAIALCIVFIIPCSVVLVICAVYKRHKKKLSK